MFPLSLNNELNNVLDVLYLLDVIKNVLILTLDIVQSIVLYLQSSWSYLGIINLLTP